MLNEYKISNYHQKGVLITGGAGFIGANLALRLVDRGYCVTVLDNLSRQVHGENEQSTLFNSIENKVKFIKGDVRNREDWEKALLGQEIVVHLAAETGTGQSMYEIEKYSDVNIRGTAIFLDIIANEKHSIKKIVIASSRAVYGEGKYQCSSHREVYPRHRKKECLIKGDFEVKCPICNKNVKLLATDEESKVHPSSIYGITKLSQEQMILTLGAFIGIPSVALRYQNVYGPGQSLSNPYTGILSIFSTRMKNGNDLFIFEDGLESRDFVYIDDAVNATILAIEKEEANGEVFNVGSGKATSVLKVGNILKELYHSQVKIIINRNFRIGDIRHNVADLRKIKSKLGFSPKVALEDGISQFVSWVDREKRHRDNYDNSINELSRRGFYSKAPV